MANFCNNVILFKGEKGVMGEQDLYITTFQSNGYNCRVLPTLSFSFVNIGKLKECLKTPELYSGLIFTSQRSVEAVNYAIEEEGFSDCWKQLPVYCVGPATENLAKNSLNLMQCMGSESGNARQLGNFIIANTKGEEKPLLYPCSAIARETIEQILKDGRINCEKIVVYETHPSETLEDDLLEAQKENSQIYVLFSPSAVKYVLTVAEKHKLLDRTKFVAIGPVTAEALQNFGVSIYATAAKPEPEALLKSIQNAQAKSMSTLS